MTTEENVLHPAPAEVVHRAEIVSSDEPREPVRSFVLPTTLPTAPGQAKNTNAPLEDCSAEVVGVRVPGGATITKFRVGPHTFNAQEGTPIEHQLRELRPRCPRMSYISATVRNDTADVQSFQVEVYLAGIDVHAAAPQIGAGAGRARALAPSGSSVPKATGAGAPVTGVRRRGPTTVNVPSRPGQIGVVVTSTPGPRRIHAPSAYVPRKSGPKFGPLANRSGLDGPPPKAEVKAKGMNVVAGRGWNRRALELVLLHLEKGHLVPSGMANMVVSYWAPFAAALGPDAKGLLKAIRTSKKIGSEEAEGFAKKIRAAANPSGSPAVGEEVATGEKVKANEEAGEKTE